MDPASLTVSGKWFHKLWPPITKEYFVYVDAREHTLVCMRVSLHACVCLCMHACVCNCVCVCIRANIYKNSHTRKTYTHTRTFSHTHTHARMHVSVRSRVNTQTPRRPAFNYLVAKHTCNNKNTYAHTNTRTLNYR